MKQQGDTKTQTQMEALDQALQGLSKVGVPLQGDEPTTTERLEELGRTFRDDLMDEILKDYPTLEREKLDRMMRADGF